MPRLKDPNPIIGLIDCPTPDCGCDRVRVMRNKAKKLYTWCPNCGTDQRTGAFVQNYITSHLAAFEHPMTPDQLDTALAELDNPPEPEPEPEPEPAFDPIDVLKKALIG